MAQLWKCAGAGFLASCTACSEACIRMDCTVTLQSAGDSELLSAVFPDIDEVKLPLVAMMHERGPACFDFEYYRGLNTDLQQYATDEQLWGQSLHFGQFERRPFRSHTFSAAHLMWPGVLTPFTYACQPQRLKLLQCTSLQGQ